MKYVTISIALLIIIIQSFCIHGGSYAASGDTDYGGVAHLEEAVSASVADDTLEHRNLVAHKESLEKEIHALQEQLDASTTLISTLKPKLDELMNQKYALEFQSLQMDGEELFRPWFEEKQRLLSLKSDIEDQRYILENEIEALKNQYKWVESNATLNELAELTVSIQDKEQAYKAIPELRAVLENMKALMLNLYSDADRRRFEILHAPLEDQGLHAIPANNVFFYGNNVKMDVMPVIKENGQVMVPIRVIATYIGADVSWDPDKQEVTVSNARAVASAGVVPDYVDPATGAITTVDLMPVYFFYCKVGEPVVKDVQQSAIPFEAPAQLICGRTFIPLDAADFILGSCGHRVEWEPESQTLIFR